MHVSTHVVLHVELSHDCTHRLFCANNFRRFFHFCAKRRSCMATPKETWRIEPHSFINSIGSKMVLCRPYWSTRPGSQSEQQQGWVYQARKKSSQRDCPFGVLRSQFTPGKPIFSAHFSEWNVRKILKGDLKKCLGEQLLNAMLFIRSNLEWRENETDVLK